jgi:hypothetical protein
MYDIANGGIQDYYNRLQREGFIESFALRVAKLPGGGYVLNDGNTRAVAAKQILQDAAVGKIKLTYEQIERIRFVPVEILESYGGSEWLKMQSKLHLQGPRTWLAAKKAGFVQKVMRKGLSREETMGILQVEQTVVTRYQATLDGYFDLQEKFPGRITESHFSSLREIMNNPATKRYLGWRGKTFTHAGHLAQLMALIAPSDGRKPIINANNAKLFRVLGDDAAEWDTMLNGNDKERKFIGLRTEKGKTINALMFSLVKRLDNLGERDLRSFEVDAAKRLVTLLNKAQTNSHAFVKLSATA